MENFLGKPYIPTPKEFKTAMFKTKLTYREYKVLDGVSSLAFEYPQERESLTIITTCRQLGELIDLPYQHVASSLKKLVSKGILTYLQKGSLKEDKNEPSIIKLNLFQEVTKSVTHTVTKSVTLTKNINKKEQQTQVKVVSSNTPSNNPPEESIEEIRKIIEEQFGKVNWEEKEKSLSAITPPLAGENKEVNIYSDKFNNTENNDVNDKQGDNGSQVKVSAQKTINVFGRVIKNNCIASAIKPDTKDTYVSSDVESSNDTDKPLPQEEFNELASVAKEIGIKPSLLSSGIKTLDARKCQYIRSTMEDIFNQIKSRYNKIRSKSAYFVHLCSEMDFTNNGGFCENQRVTPFASGSPIPVSNNVIDSNNAEKPVKKSPSEVKREADIKQAQMEKKEMTEFIETLSEEKLQEYHKRASQDWKRETKGFAGINPLPGYVEYKIKTYAEQEGIWNIFALT